MKAKNPDLHGNVPQTSTTALLIVDMINDLEFEGGDILQPKTLAVAQHILQLKEKCAQNSIPTIYVNDNFGKWRSNLNEQINHCLKDNTRGKTIVEILRPLKEDYFILKTKNSGFYFTPLELLLQYLNAQKLIITGITSDSCILFTSMDAYIRDYELKVPANCTTAVNDTKYYSSLEYIKTHLKADVNSL